MKTTTFAHFKIFYNNPITVLAYLKEGKNGISLHTDMQFNPLHEHVLYSENMTESDARQIMKDLNFIEVKDGFDSHDVDHLREIKSQLPAAWIENHNSWATYTG